MTYESSGAEEVTSYGNRVAELFRDIQQQIARLRETADLERKPGESHEVWDDRMSITEGDETVVGESEEMLLDYWRESVPKEMQPKVLAELEAHGNDAIVLFLRRHHALPAD